MILLPEKRMKQTEIYGGNKNMTDKQFARRLAKLNTALWDCIGEAETLCDEAKNKSIDDNMKKLFAQYNEEGGVDCDLHNATLSDISLLIKSMMN